MANRHGKADLLQVQVAIKIRAPKGTKIAPQVMQQILDRAVNGEDLPANVELKGIFWRNPNRRGTLSYWRYHEGADLNARPTNAPIESRPRGSLSDAVATLSGALYSGIVTV